MEKKISIQDIQDAQILGVIRLFQYIQKVSELIGKEKSYKILEKLVTEKRVNWIKKHKEIINQREDPIDRGYSAFFKQYLKLNPSDVQLIERTNEKWVMRWKNFCPVLEACKALHLDTKEICKKCYEKPVQEFLSQIHPRLKFSRNYHKIRPYTEFCEEIIELSR